MQISPIQVLKSNAGYYLGRTYYDLDCDAWFPYDRHSGYYPTKELATAALQAL